MSLGVLNRPSILVLAASMCLAAAPVFAQVRAPAPGATPGAAPADEPEPLPSLRFDEVVITGAPIARTVSQLAQPVLVLQDEKLLELQAPQLGEVLGDEPGVSQTYFGPGASRPVIRGLGGDNIRVLENGLGLLDVSAVSPDHAVSLEPLLTRRIEVVRGPSALLYGPFAIGGVVNVITTRIPDEPIDVPLRGVLEGRGNSVNSEGAGVAVLEGGYRGFAFHLDGFARKTDNISIPGFARSPQLRAIDPLPPGEREEQGVLVNSALETQGGAGGVSYVWDGGYVGLAPSVYDTTYGIPGAPSTFIELSNRRLDFASELDSPLPHLTTVKGKLGLVDYEHTENELTVQQGAVVGTEFKNRGYDLRLEGLHAPLAGFEGAFGFESYYADFDATGAEAFAPPSITAIQSLFAFEDVNVEPVRVQLAGRVDFSSVDADAAAGFGPADSRDFVTGGASVGAIYTPVDPYSIAFTVVYTQRPPNAVELYADGPHLATQQYEIGDRNLSSQESLGLELLVRKSTGRVTGSVGGFYNRFDNFIDLFPTGEFIDISERTHGHSHGGESILPVFQFENTPADFAGMEAEATVHVFEAAPHSVDLDLQADYVYAQNRDTGEPLPYIPPFRLGADLVYAFREFSADLSMLWAREQDEVPEYLLPTDGYVWLGAGMSYQFTFERANVNLYLRGFNLLDQDARVATSTLKDVAPLPGAGALFGFRLRL